MARIVVIGAGVVGAMIAWRLAEKRIEVVLLDRAEPGGAATGASYGGLTANGKLPRAYFDLTAAALVEHRRLAWKLVPSLWYHVDGNLRWSGDAAAPDERVDRLRSWGYPAETLPGSTVLANLEPGLAGGVVDQEATLAWFPEEAWVDAAAMTAQIIIAARHAGARVLSGPGREVVAIGIDGGAVGSVTLAGGQTIEARGIVNAAGAEAGEVAALVGRQLPMDSPNGLIVRLEMPDGGNPLRRPLETERFAARPDGPGRVLVTMIGASIPEVAECAPGPLALDDPIVTTIIGWAAELLPALTLAWPTGALVAVRPSPASGFPSVGGVPGIPGYFEAATPAGVTLAPLIGRSLADEILGQPPDPLLAPYRPERMSLSGVN